MEALEAVNTRCSVAPAFLVEPAPDDAALERKHATSPDNPQNVTNGPAVVTPGVSRSWIHREPASRADRSGTVAVTDGSSG